MITFYTENELLKHSTATQQIKQKKRVKLKKKLFSNCPIRNKRCVSVCVCPCASLGGNSPGHICEHSDGMSNYYFVTVCGLGWGGHTGKPPLPVASPSIQGGQGGGST